MHLAEPVWANMGGERVRDIQTDDDTKESRAPIAGAEYDWAEIWSHACIPHVWGFYRRWIGHGRSVTVCYIKSLYKSTFYLSALFEQEEFSSSLSYWYN